MRSFLLLGLFVLSFSSLQAQVLTFDHGEMEFYTNTVLSDIEAVTEEVEVKLDVQTGTIEIAVNINSFEFEYETMKEHFNDKYMESDKFPQATFKGKITQDISTINEELEVDGSGDLTIHGVSRKIEVKATLSKNDGLTVIKTKFPVVFKDYGVDDPSILTKPVAKNVEVKCTLYLKGDG
ncbi:MAG TPA: YceI family protein [Draconibacterium sp.]|nr:YceI family protein [Draconibacterium sp.]